jgi:hypothetical protein
MASSRRFDSLFGCFVETVCAYVLAFLALTDSDLHLCSLFVLLVTFNIFSCFVPSDVVRLDGMFTTFVSLRSLGGNEEDVNGSPSRSQDY